MNIYKYLILLMCFTICSAVALADLTEEEKAQIKRQFTFNTSIPKAVWKVLLEMHAAPKIGDFTFGHNLTALVLAGYDVGIQFSRGKGTPPELAAGIAPGFFRPVSIIQQDYITEITYNDENDVITGQVAFVCKDLYEGKIEYRAEKHNQSWKVVEMLLPNRGSRLRLEKIENNRTIDGEGIWHLGFNREVWILREIHFYLRQDGYYVYHHNIAPADPGELISKEALLALLRNSGDDKVFYDYSSHKRYSRVADFIEIFDLYQQAGLDFSQHITCLRWYEEELAEMAAIKEFSRQYAAKQLPTADTLVIEATAKDPEVMLAAENNGNRFYFQFIDNNGQQPDFTELREFIATAQKDIVHLQLDPHLKKVSAIAIYNEIQAVATVQIQFDR